MRVHSSDSLALTTLRFFDFVCSHSLTISYLGHLLCGFSRLLHLLNRVCVENYYSGVRWGRLMVTQAFKAYGMC